MKCGSWGRCLRLHLLNGQTCQHGEEGGIQGGVDSNGGGKDLMVMLPNSAVMVSQRTRLWRSKMERRSCRAQLCMSCLRPDVVGQLPNICSLVKNCLHMGQRRVGLCEMERALCAPHMSSF
jgi:hypothetical protein